ncbi:hypothetical protein [Butyrivibrio sp. XPD2006]|uniref:hypothetical protein n=1 Tax=Butyrivibrio sp. XPD2006 TaxID=1280668 RepID=UPI0003B30862|nr:hypothetical protein [Butyrivibrio sp. XPD2006]
MFCRSTLTRIAKAAESIVLGVLILTFLFPVTTYATSNVTYPTPSPNGTTAKNPTTTSVEIDEDTLLALEKFNDTYKDKKFNALCYFLNYQDLRFDVGADPNALFQHYKTFGYNENRVADRIINPESRQWRSKFEYVVPRYQKTKKQQDGMAVIPDEIHSNGGMNRRQENEARSVALQLARHVYDRVNNNGSGTQIEMVAYATGIVNGYCAAGKELTREEVESSNNKLYRTAYGVFIAHQYTCAGSTRALGLILDYLDKFWYADWQAGNKAEYIPLKWVHVNANKWEDQWCQIVCDNHEAYADPIKSWAGYGVHPNWGGKKQDFRQYYGYAFESDIINTRPRYVDGEYQLLGDPTHDNANPMGDPNQYDSYSTHAGVQNPQNP